MTREFYTVERAELDGSTYTSIKYEGYLWHRPDGGERPYACTTISNCRIIVNGGALPSSLRAARLAERREQYQDDLTEAEYNTLLDAFFNGVTGGELLHIDSVTADTPCGHYHYDTED